MAGGRAQWSADTWRQYIGAGGSAANGQVDFPSGYGDVGITDNALQGKRYPNQMIVESTGSVFVKDVNGTARRIDCQVAGMVYNIRVKELDGTSTTADYITFLFNEG